MSELIIANKDDLTDIADAVRSHTGENNPMSLEDIADEIRTFSASNSTGISVQADWQQSDANSPDYVKNRTHWIENSTVEVFPETTLEIKGATVSLIDYGITLLRETTPCIVTIDGVAYETSARYSKYNAYEMWVIGNGDLIGEDLEDDHLPFAIFIDGSDDWFELEEGNKTVTLKIEITGNVIHKIPDIYLPERIGKLGTGGSSEIFNDLANNIASADYTHAEGFKTTASGYAAHSEGHTTTASAYGGHAEGCYSKASGAYSHSEGYYSEAKGARSHAEGSGTIASGENQHASGSYNIEDKTSLIIVGNGSSSSNRSNAYKLDKSGNGYFSGDVYARSSKLATEDYINIRVPAWTDADEGKVLKIINGVPTWN